MQRCTCQSYLRRFSTSAHVLERGQDVGTRKIDYASFLRPKTAKPTVAADASKSLFRPIRHKEHKPPPIRHEGVLRSSKFIKHDSRTPLLSRDAKAKTKTFSKPRMGSKPPKEPPRAASLSAFEELASEPINVDAPDAQKSRNRRDRKTIEQEKKLARELGAPKRPVQAQGPAAPHKKQVKPKTIQITRDLVIPSLISVAHLAMVLKVKLGEEAPRAAKALRNTVPGRLQQTMVSLGIENTRPDRLLTADDTAIIAMSFDYNAIIDDEKAFDIFPDPPTEDASALLPRPPIVAIMGHVDHGKTTLLDKLRSASVAAGEAGGITQHIGAFEVSRESMTGIPTNPDSSIASLTFLDTPGHAAFKSMRSRGKGVTDIVILVVAADDGVMAQTKEVIDLITDGQGNADESVGVVVAITKCDKPGVDVLRVKEGLGAAGLVVEDMGGDVPCVEVSAMTGDGLDTLIETVTAVAEVRDIKAERQGVRTEGRVIESRLDKGRGNVATVLVLRGTLKISDTLVAGTARCKVRQLVSSSGATLKSALPSQPIEVIGWKELPHAGDEVLQSSNEDEARRVIEARLRRKEQASLITDVEAINAKRLVEAEQAAEHAALKAKAERSRKKQPPAPAPAEPTGPKQLLLIVKADVHGSQEAVVQSLDGIGNQEAVAKIVSSGVGDVTESDVVRAKSLGATIIGFNVKCPKSLQAQAQSANIPLLIEPVIYRLIERVTTDVENMLAPIVESRIVGEASVLQVFRITVKGRVTRPVAGCRVGNGTITRNCRVRVMRGKEQVYDGTVSSLKHVKTDIDTAIKGSECGMSFEGFEEFQEGDTVLAYETYEVKRRL